MSVHTYIGARYVPRFLGTYDPTQIYEALDVVDNGAGTSYIARKTVPANTPLLDNNYWFLYGSSSGAIVQLQNDMIQAQSDILGLDNDVDALKAAGHREILVIGNSYVQLGIASRLEALFNASYEKIYGGAAFVPFTGHTNTFVTALQDAVADASIDKTKITDILFVSAHGDTGAYDEHGAANYLSLLTAAFGTIQGIVASDFPNIKKVSIALGESRNQAYYTGTFSAMFRVHGLFATFAARYGFDYIGWPGFNLLFESSFFNSDNVHFNTAGSYVAGNYLKAAYFGKLVYVNKNGTSSGIPFAYSADGVINVWVSYNPDSTDVYFGQTTQSATAAVTLVDDMTLIDLDHSSLRISCPAPLSPITSPGPMYPSTGMNIAEMLFPVIMDDAHGILKIHSYFAPRQSVTGAAHFSIPHLHFTYKNY